MSRYSMGGEHYARDLHGDIVSSDLAAIIIMIAHSPFPPAKASRARVLSPASLAHEGSLPKAAGRSGYLEVCLALPSTQ